MKVPYLHVYAQPFWHQEAFITGNTEALTALRDALTVAIETGKASVLSYTGDCEGYDLHVYKQDGEEYWDKALLPYTDEVACVQTKDAVGPWQLYKERKIK